MALTNDEINEILELYGRNYSGRKIAEKTEHSDVTVYSYIHQAKERVSNLIIEGMDADQIVSQLNYPYVFVDRIMRESSANHKEDEKDAFESEEAAEEIVPTAEIDVRADWDHFQKDLELEQRKEDIRDEVKGLINLLEDSETDYKKKGVLDTAYNMCQKVIKKEIEDFILTRVAEIHSIEAMSELEGIIKEIDERIEALLDEYDKKASESVKARKIREKALSDKLCRG